ncbi:MAG: FAD-binding oxidoreductase [Gemmatimonadetes bacterium]|nr:FAD-binding oxidoreductase [Gemmatimonadota bacterium]
MQYPPEVMASMRAVKRWVDPEWRLNPGILIDPS